MFQTQFFTVALALLSTIVGSLSNQLQSDMATGNILLNDGELYIKKEIVGGSTINLLDANTKNLKGICNFDEGGKLQPGRAFVFDKIALNYATHATLTGQEAKLDYNTKAPNPLLNADFVVTQNGKQILRMPVRSIHNFLSGRTFADEYKQLATLRHFVDQKNIKLDLEFPDGEALDNAVKHYILIRFAGVETVTKPTS